MDWVDWVDWVDLVGSSAFLGLCLAAELDWPVLSVFAFLVLGFSTWSSAAFWFAACVSSSAWGVGMVLVSDMVSVVVTFVLDCLPVGVGYAPVGRVTFFLF